ncbi:MAG: hypothetical protein ABEJ30_09815 [Halorientalis sp.]
MTDDSSDAVRGTARIGECPTPEIQVDVDGQQVTRGVLLAVDADTVERPLPDYKLVLGPATGGHRFTVFRATDTVEVPAGSCLRPSLDAMVVADGDYRYAVVKAAFVPPEAAEGVWGDRLIEFPPALRGGLIVESEPTSPALWELLTSSERRARERDDPGESSPEARQLLDSLL